MSIFFFLSNLRCYLRMSPLLPQKMVFPASHRTVTILPEKLFSLKSLLLIPPSCTSLSLFRAGSHHRL